jgi:hypothetical protein
MRDRPVRPIPIDRRIAAGVAGLRDTGGLVFHARSIRRTSASLFGEWQHWTLFVQAEPTTFVATRRVLQCNIASATIVTAMAPTGLIKSPGKIIGSIINT